jgi:hypothetical protein
MRLQRAVTGGRAIWVWYFLEVVCNKSLSLVSEFGLSTTGDASYCCFRLVKLHASCQASLCEQTKLRDDKLVELWWGSARGTAGHHHPTIASHAPPWDTAASCVSVTASAVDVDSDSTRGIKLSRAPDQTIPKQASILSITICR